MYFETECSGIKYLVHVNEHRHMWKIALKEADRDWTQYDIPKADYKSLDDTISFLFKNSSYLIDVVANGNDVSVFSRGSYRAMKIYNDEMLLHESLKSGDAGMRGDSLVAGMPGKITKVFIKVGDTIEADSPLLIMEAMKMENELRASHKAKIKKINVNQGDSVEAGALLVEFEALEKA